jgi:hypothetical protein
MTPLSDLGWIAHSMLRGGGWGCALRVEAHFDESGTDAKELTLAGYLFEAERIDLFSVEWNALLSKYDLPYFHMVDCAPGNPPFHKLGKTDRTKLQMQLQLIKRYSINGIVCNIPNINDNIGKSYLEGVRGAVRLALEWADKVSFAGNIAYLFEAGATGQGLADGHFQQIATDPASSAAHRYAGHAFLPKAGNPGVQAADLLAWQYHNFTKKRAKAGLARLDLRALLRHPHHMSDLCGDLPREPNIQSVEASRSRIETVYYLPAATHDEIAKAAIFHPKEDLTVMTGVNHGQVLACPNCFRAVCEGVSVSDLWKKLIVDHYLMIRCWCGTYCRIPKVMAPFAQ